MVIGLIGVLIVPYMITLAESVNIPPLVIVSLIGFIGTFGFLFLDETLDMPLPHNIKELNYGYSNLEDANKKVKD